MTKALSVREFLAHSGPCFDVRSPSEHAHSCLPDARCLALFTDEERALVGTCYKKQGKDPAVRLGVKLVGPKLASILEAVDEANPSRGEVKVYCWRGGMRSSFASYFLNFAGHSTLQLVGGYKAYRRCMLNQLSQKYHLLLIGGFTGSGKTEVLSALAKAQQQVIDLEKQASHRGSVYGELLGTTQPSIEQFENHIGYSLYQAKSHQPIWLEDESRLIGRCTIPTPFYEAMKRAPLFVIGSSLDARLERILSSYRSFPKDHWVISTLKIQKRLGSECTKNVLQHIEENRLADAIYLLLTYYDRAYAYAIEQHKGPVIRFPESEKSPQEWAKILLDAKEVFAK